MERAGRQAVEPEGFQRLDQEAHVVGTRLTIDEPASDWIPGVRTGRAHQLLGQHAVPSRSRWPRRIEQGPGGVHVVGQQAADFSARDEVCDALARTIAGEQPRSQGLQTQSSVLDVVECGAGAQPDDGSLRVEIREQRVVDDRRLHRASDGSAHAVILVVGALAREKSTTPAVRQRALHEAHDVAGAANPIG